MKETINIRIDRNLYQLIKKIKAKELVDREKELTHDDVLSIALKDLAIKHNVQTAPDEPVAA